MNYKKTALTLLAASGVLLSLNMNTPVNAATIQTPINKASYIKKGNTYKLHLKTPGRVTISTRAKYQLVNSAGWKCIPYNEGGKNTSVFYLRAGNYKLTTNSKNTRIKTSFTKLTTLKSKLDSYPISKTTDTYENPAQIELNQKVNGFIGMYKTYKSSEYHYYKFTLDKAQKVTMDLTTMPIYQVNKQVGHLYIAITAEKNDMFIPSTVVKGQVTNKKYSWYLPKGSYIVDLYIMRGRYNFKLSAEDSNEFPSDTEITSTKSVADGLEVKHTKSSKRAGYVYYLYTYKNGKWTKASSFTDNENGEQYTIPKSFLTNGQKYMLYVRPFYKDGQNMIYGNVSKSTTFTYFAANSGETNSQLTAPTISVSYYDDGGSDEPYINIDWPENKNLDSYEISYRVKGSSTWTSYLTNSKNGYELTDSSDKTNPLYFTKGKVIEIRVRGMKGYQTTDWSATKEVTITNNPAR